ncbi:deoxyguanosinetriphosphate triphosphohydrolase [Radicibacter daui]|uniref:deoxyguanosinetriphosphate triphosphohydrolase n=1 Tax=Radicibacter daui TaxID=3064829 RepID=UPI00404693CF
MIQLKPYATHPEASRGRLLPEPESKHRNCHQRDRDRIIHSNAFRRLKYKTQVFVYYEGDYYRTRLSHSLEVAQITRSLARTLGLNEDLAECIALAHDLGHAPFAHAGEDELDALMQPYGGFEHNDQTLRILTSLEHRYAAFDGLNLTWESLEGVVKHNGPLLHADGSPKKKMLAATIAGFNERMDLDLSRWPSAEAQIAAIADDIAYTSHDIDDGIRSGLIALDDLLDLPLVGPMVREVKAAYPQTESRRLVYEVVRRLLDRMTTEVLAETERRIAALKPTSSDDIRAASTAVVAFPASFWSENIAPIRAFLYQQLYRHWRVNRMRNKVRRVMREMFELFMEHPGTLPPEWQVAEKGGATQARAVCDYIAGMTDRFALEEYQRLFDPFTKT